MSRSRVIKILGLLSAITASAVAALSGDYITAAGVVAAALSSGDVVTKEATK